MHSHSLMLNKLLSQLELTVKKKVVTFSDAKYLSEQLAKRKLFISAHTLGRLFGIIKPYRKPYKETLNVLCKFLGYNDWEDYNQKESLDAIDPKYFQTEDEDGFSISLLELALVNNDIKSLENLLEQIKYTDDHYHVFYALSDLIGNYVRKSKIQDELLEIIAKIPQGRLLFYECFVDEDNNNNYFSNALKQYYLPKITNNNKKLFVHSFNLASNLYRNIDIDENITHFKNITEKVDLLNCHFHEVSRFLECSIIIDAKEDILKNTINYHIERLLEICNSFENFKKNWIIARPIRAIIFFGFVNELTSHKKFNQLVDSLFENRNNEYKNMALYIIQLYFLYKEKKNNSNHKVPAFRLISTNFFNNENEKKAIEFTMAFLFSNGKQKENIKSKLIQFCEVYGNRWVLPLTKIND